MTEAVNLCGSEQYVVCPTCTRVVPEELRTAAYKSVWTRKNAKRISRQDSEAAGPAAVDARQTVTPEEWLRERLEFEEKVAKSRAKHLN